MQKVISMNLADFSEGLFLDLQFGLRLACALPCFSLGRDCSASLKCAKALSHWKVTLGSRIPIIAFRTCNKQYELLQFVYITFHSCTEVQKSCNILSEYISLSVSNRVSYTEGLAALNVVGAFSLRTVVPSEKNVVNLYPNKSSGNYLTRQSC